MKNIIRKKNILYILFAIVTISLTQCSGNVDDQLKLLAKEANKQCPKNLDQWTRLDSCAALPNKHYKYYHTISEVLIQDTTLFKSNLTPEIIKTIKISPDMKYFRNNDITLEYEYSDPNKVYLFSIKINPENYKN